MAQQCVLIRHGDTGDEFRGRFIGSTDVNLSSLGLRQAEALGSRLTAMQAAAHLCSPMQRTIETAQRALGESAAFELETSLVETDFGEWEGLSFEEIQRGHPQLVDSWAGFDIDFAFPDGESIAGFTDRIRRVGEMIALHPAETVVAFTHGGVIRSLICHYLGLDFRNYLLFEVSPASVSVLTLFDGKGVLTLLNDNSHLEGV